MPINQQTDITDQEIEINNLIAVNDCIIYICQQTLVYNLQQQVQFTNMKILVNLIPPYNSDLPPLTLNFNPNKIKDTAQLRTKIAVKYYTFPQLVTLIHNNKFMEDKDEVNFVSLLKDPQIYLSIAQPNKQQSLEQLLGLKIEHNQNNLQKDNQLRYIQYGSQQHCYPEKRQNPLDSSYINGVFKTQQIRNLNHQYYITIEQQKLEVQKKIRQIKIQMQYEQPFKKMQAMGFTNLKLCRTFLLETKGDIPRSSELYMMYEEQDL